MENNSVTFIMENDLIRRAVAFADKAHEGQLRKDGVMPFITHPIGSMYLLYYSGVRDPYDLATMPLHDVVEDCDVSIEMIYGRFGRLVGDNVAFITREKGLPRRDYLERIVKAPPKKQRLKLADVAHNIQTVETLPQTRKVRFVTIADHYFTPIAKRISPPLYNIIDYYVSKAKNSTTWN